MAEEAGRNQTAQRRVCCARESITALLVKLCFTMAASGARWSFSPEEPGAISPSVMSAPGEPGSVNADSWTFSEPLPKQAGFSWLEGCILLAPDAEVVNMSCGQTEPATTERPSFMSRPTATRSHSIRRMISSTCPAAE